MTSYHNISFKISKMIIITPGIHKGDNIQIQLHIIYPVNFKIRNIKNSGKINELQPQFIFIFISIIRKIKPGT